MKVLFTAMMAVLVAIVLDAQITTVNQLPSIDDLDPVTVNRFNLVINDGELGQPTLVPVIIVKGAKSGPRLGITAAIHGNELNGIKVIHELVAQVNPDSLSGSIIAVPGANPVGITLNTRTYMDGVDLNRIFPGKENGNRSQQFVYHLCQKLLPHFDYLVDMHTASFGRENSLYIRGDLNDTIIGGMMMVQDADILFSNKGKPSAGANSSSTRTLRAEAILRGIPTITVEYGNPQVYQKDMIRRGLTGMQNLLVHIGMTTAQMRKVPSPITCYRSYWIYTDRGGYLDTNVELTEIVEEGQLIATQHSPHGELVREYHAPQRGVVIGRSSNPVNPSGGRIIHLGIMEQ